MTDEKRTTMEEVSLDAPCRKIMRNGKIIRDDGGPSDYPGYFDEEGHMILPDEMNDDRPPTPDECKALKGPGKKIIRDGKVVPYDGKRSDYPGYFDEDGNFIQTEDDSGFEWYRSVANRVCDSPRSKKVLTGIFCIELSRNRIVLVNHYISDTVLDNLEKEMIRLTGDFIESLKKDIITIKPIIVVAILVGCFLSLFINNLAISITKMNPVMGTMYSTMYFRATGIVPTLLCGAGSVVLMGILPRMRGQSAGRENFGSHIAAVAIAGLIVEIVILIAHICLILLKNGNLDGYTFVPVAYIGLFLLILGFASVGLLAVGLFREPKKMLGFTGGVSIWFLLASMMGVLSLPLMVTTGAGAEWFSGFYFTTITGFIDINSITTLGTAAENFDFILGYVGLAAFICILTAAGWYAYRRKTA